MERPCQRRSRTALLVASLSLLLAGRLCAADTLTWHTNDNRVSADIRAVPLLRLLEGVSQLTGWQVFLESNTTHTVSVKFKDLPSGQALRSLLGNLNFALVPDTNSHPRLYVFHSSRQNATLLVRPGDLNGSGGGAANPIANELVIALKRGVKVETLACLDKAKITGRIEALNTYRLKFENEADARAARDCLATNSDVETIDSNFAMNEPIPTLKLDSNVAASLDLKLKDPSGDCSVIVGLIDTGFSSLGQGLDKFLLPAISAVDGGKPANPGQLTHGPAMAETILRSVQGATSGNTSIKILPVDVYGANTTTTTFDVAVGVQRAVNSGANIINMSLGSSGNSTVLHNLIKKATDQGVVFFGAAGNEPVTTPTYPAAYPEVIAVTAGDRNGQVASYANRGDFVDIMTPGTSVVPFDGQSYVINGTSAATAYASGIAAGLADANKACPGQVVPTIRNKLGVNLGAPK